jgi:hypothetical protein
MRSLLVILLTLFPFITPAAGQGQLNLRAEVPKIVSIEIIPNNLAGDLPLNQSQSRLKVAETLEKWNSIKGTKIQINSANRGNLVHETMVASKIPYTLHFRGRKVNLSNTRSVFRRRRGVATLSSPIEVSYSGSAFHNLIEGSYSDVITFIISAN